MGGEGRKPTCAQVRYLRDLFLLVDQLVERAEDAQELLHLVSHGHALQDLYASNTGTQGKDQLAPVSAR